MINILALLPDETLSSIRLNLESSFLAEGTKWCTPPLPTDQNDAHDGRS